MYSQVRCHPNGGVHKLGSCESRNHSLSAEQCSASGSPSAATDSLTFAYPVLRFLTEWISGTLGQLQANYAFQVQMIQYKTKGLTSLSKYWLHWDYISLYPETLSPGPADGWLIYVVGEGHNPNGLSQCQWMTICTVKICPVRGAGFASYMISIV